ncbi:chaps-domain-containing protein [Linderina pennispora]|uniref:Chaps-domain-containing protein n=1 Tax=Linderina pennispora TaxID=61395 RepID=A0A1Y1W3E6_9FUNG|nr:chaps-domain-containing protein [Linderina pennispora]ORX67987.1 chaps-domain-containing protein [Linderina pennispora]
MAHNDCLQDVPDIFENEIGESLNSRSEGLGMIRELGPPDLCHIVKIHSSNRNEPDIGSYHHVLGVDTSSSATLAAYINSLQYSLNDTPGWFGSNNSWKITSGTYCSYNAFSNVDLRVQVKIPGGVDAYVVTAQGERKEATEQMWKECYISAMLRAILYADPMAYNVTGLRRVTPVSNSREETRFMEAIVEQFWNGWALGSNAETQVASNARNFLVDGLMRYFADAGRFDDCAAEILAPLAYSPLGGQRGSIDSPAAEFKGVDPEVASLLADAYVECDEEVQAVRVMHQALKVRPSCYPLLYTQSEFLRRKKNTGAALTIARMAVKYAPSEFQAWAKLTDIYIDCEDFQRALLTLNTCPMYTFVDRDYPRVPTPRRINFPVKSDILAEYNLGEHISNDTHAHGPVPTNSRSSMETPTLKGTFARAYDYLTRMVSIVGWDELLQLRSQAFVMEDEYRNSAHPNQAVDDEDDDEDDLPLAALRQKSKESADAPPVAAPPVDTPSAHKPESPAETEPVTEPADTVKNEPTEGDRAEPVEDTKTEPVGDDKAEPAENGKADADDNLGISPQSEMEPEVTVEPGEEPAIKNDKPKNEHEAVNDETEGGNAGVETTTEPGGSSKSKKNKKRKNKKKSKENLKEAAQLEPASTEELTEPPVAETDANADASATADGENDTPSKDKTAAIEDGLEEIKLSDAEEEQPKSEDTKLTEPESPPEEVADVVSAPQAAVLPADDQSGANEGTDKQPKEDAGVRQDGDESDEDSGHGLIRKRLCERWLDNLIMILFDDLRAYTAWRSEMHNLRATGQQITFRHTQAEWEALGDLALRLRHPSEAKEAFEYALNIRFSAKAWQHLLELYSGAFSDMQDEERLRNEDLEDPIPISSSDSLMAALDAVVWLTVYHDRWYNSMAYPNPVCEQVIRLVRTHGLSKVQNAVVSLNLKPAVHKLVARYFAIAEKFEVEGSSW